MGKLTRNSPLIPLCSEWEKKNAIRGDQMTIMEETKHAGGRPIEYTEDIVTRTKEYLEKCVDDIEEYHKTRGDKSDSYDRIVRVKIPTIEGLAVYLDINKSTIYEWEKKFPEFSHVITKLRDIQADRLVNNGLSGDYNPTIAKVLLTKHGYREGVDTTTNDKDLPAPIINVQRNDSIQEDKQPN